MSHASLLRILLLASLVITPLGAIGCGDSSGGAGGGAGGGTGGGGGGDAGGNGGGAGGGGGVPLDSGTIDGDASVEDGGGVTTDAGGITDDGGADSGVTMPPDAGPLTCAGEIVMTSPGDVPEACAECMCATCEICRTSDNCLDLIACRQEATAPGGECEGETGDGLYYCLTLTACPPEDADSNTALYCYSSNCGDQCGL